MVALIRKLKTEKQLSLKAPLTHLHLYSSDASLIAHLSPCEQLIRGVTHAEQITFTVGSVAEQGLHAHGDQWHAAINMDQKSPEHSHEHSTHNQ